MPTPMLSEHIIKAPLDNILEAVTTSILNTQEQLNQQSIAIAGRLAGASPEDQVRFGTSKYSLLELGFVPEFYQLGETEVKLKMAMHLERNGAELGVYGSLLNERNLCGFGFDAEGASQITAKLIPTSVPNVFEKRVGQMMLELTQKAFNHIRDYVIAQNAAAMNLYELEQTGINDLLEANLPDYRAALIALHPDELPNIPSLQQVVLRVNAFVVIRDYVLANDTRPMTIKELYATGVQGAVDRNLSHYRSRLSALLSLNHVDGLQVVVTQSNAFGQILALMQLSQFSSLTQEMFAQAGIIRVNPDRWSLYIAALEALSAEVLETYTQADLQQLIDTANQ
jgi:hypothetical protein